MITLLSSPKPFAGVDDGNQRRAVASWRSIHPEAEVILYGASPGTAEACAALGARHVPAIASTPAGIPYFDAIVEHARDYAQHDIQVYLNCDILLTDAILRAAACIEFPRFLMMGQRVDLGEGVILDPSQPRWPDELARLAREGKVSLHDPGGMDYFIFPRGMWEGLKPIIIGRCGYDSALVAFCLRRRIPVIDATFAVPVFHQFHGYGHVQGGHHMVHFGEEARQNRRVHGVERSAPNVSDARWQLRDGRVLHTSARGDRLRSAELHVRFVRGCQWGGLGLRAIWRALTAIGIYRPERYELTQVLAAYAATTTATRIA